MSAIFLLPVCLNNWPRKYTTRVDPHVDNSHEVWSWHDHPLPSYSDFCLLIRHGTLWPCPLTFWPWTVVIRGGSRDKLRRQVWRPYAYPFLSWVITFPAGYHWKCVRDHCACAESRDPWVGGQKQLHFWNPRPRFASTTFIGLRRRLRVVYSRASPMLKPVIA